MREVPFAINLKAMSYIAEQEARKVYRIQPVQTKDGVARGYRPGRACA